LRIGQNHLAHRLVIFDVTGAAAEMTVERLGNGLFKICAGHAFSRQPLEQYLTLVEKARGAIAALKGEVINEGFLQAESSPSLA